MQERAIALTTSSSRVPPNPGNAVVQNVPAALRIAPPQPAACSTFAMPQAVHRPAAFAAPASLRLSDDWDAVQFEQIESVMAAAGALGTNTGAVHAKPAHGTAAAPEAAPLGATDDTQAVQTLALSRTQATALESV